jgi:hypothetical protein
MKIIKSRVQTANCFFYRGLVDLLLINQFATRRAEVVRNLQVNKKRKFLFDAFEEEDGTDRAND